MTPATRRPGARDVVVGDLTDRQASPVAQGMIPLSRGFRKLCI
jgi:hypothetical protein